MAKANDARNKLNANKDSAAAAKRKRAAPPGQKVSRTHALRGKHMRFTVPLTDGFRGELESIEPPLGSDTRLHLDEICRSQIILLEYVRLLFKTLSPLGWTDSYDKKTEAVVFENSAVPAAKTVKDVVAYLRKHLSAADADSALDYVEL